MMQPRAVAIYARTSGDPDETRAGVERQRADCRAEDRLGWTVREEFIDNDVSAYSGKPRPQYERMLSEIEAGSIDGLLVWHQDRLSRRPIDLEHFFEVIDRAGISGNVRTVARNADYQAGDGILTARLLSAVAANESATKSRRIRRKKEELAAAGLPITGGRRPFGYRATNSNPVRLKSCEISPPGSWPGRASSLRLGGLMRRESRPRPEGSGVRPRSARSSPVLGSLDWSSTEARSLVRLNGPRSSASRITVESVPCSRSASGVVAAPRRTIC